MARFAALTARLVATATLGLAGCCYYEVRDCIDECSCDMRAEFLARQAWCRCEDSCDDHLYQKYYGRGFRDGYASVARGGDGCCPTIPPRDCWGWCFDGHEGRARTHAWFDGWSRGAIAAEADGLLGSGRIAVRKPACPTGCLGGPISPSDSVIAPTPAAPAVIRIPEETLPPPPAPPSLAPASPTDEAYESNDEGGPHNE